MIRSLKIKFIITNMLIVIIVFAIAFSMLYFNTYNSFYKDSINAMKKAVDKSFGFDIPFDIGIGNRDTNSDDTTVFYVTLNKDHSPSSIIGNNVRIIDKDKFVSMVKSCYQSGKKSGTVKTEKLRFLITESKYYGEVIAFADISRETVSLSRLVQSYSVIGLIMLAVFFAISLLLAKWATQPVKKSIQSQNRFVADASHELKTPLTVILANTELLEKECSDETTQKRLGYIKTEAESMKSLVSDMLTLAKNDASKKIDLMPMSLSDAVNSQILIFEPLAFEKGKVLHFDIKDGLSINGNREQIERLVAILLDNALKYSNDGGTIDVYLYQNGSKTNLSVRNSGEPIPADRIKHLFERFYRLDDARARQTGGFGLGLSIANDIAKTHSAEINVQSNQSIGTVFTVSFKAIH